MNFVQENNRTVYYDADGQMLAEVTFTDQGDYVEIDHTFVSETLRGQGVADQITRSLLERLRKENRKAVAVCPYTVKWKEKNRDFDDVWVQGTN